MRFCSSTPIGGGKTGFAKTILNYSEYLFSWGTDSESIRLADSGQCNWDAHSFLRAVYRND